MPTLIDFTAGDEIPRWHAINDDVMGGVSQGAMHEAEGIGVFAGELTLTNGGGFASARREREPMRLSDYAGVVVRARGDGRTYQLRLYTHQLTDGGAYRALVHPPAGEWQRIALPWHAFEAIQRGRLLENAPPLAPDDIQQLGLLIADRRDGAFRLEIARIETLDAR
ncbi:monofunctional biosynthetic peptidoglycan transglycosylase [Franzmannia pantelleriensis]|uniref:Monofunctional biosynthetic peptidoglycan transglycosylase n=1 Tax=Franzmannia pantelleriensis TaxID=48727 RepID=A0A1G9URM6_9GAMM|nr:CIA30 family protein [Halomonas pantelleriensis]SDM62457.1 monofunctional biosynthetic peptidoglycan transglycosylase [Halomonas pantelleriensis]